MGTLTIERNPYGAIFSNFNLLALLLIVDLSIMLAYLMSYKYLSNALIFDIDKDFTIPSLYGYALLGGSTLCSYLSSKEATVYRPLAYLFAFFFVDDIVSLHENFGKFLGHFVIPKNVLFFTRRSLGETIFISIVASFFLFHVIRSYIIAARFEKKIICVAILLVSILGVFGVLVDLAHDYYRKIDQDLFFWMGFFEDVGEMFTMSVTFWFCYNLYRYYARRHVWKLTRPTLRSVRWYDRVGARTCLVGYAHQAAMVSATRR
jgi:hypothetical protein